MSPGVVYSVT